MASCSLQWRFKRKVHNQIIHICRQGGPVPPAGGLCQVLCRRRFRLRPPGALHRHSPHRPEPGRQRRLRDAPRHRSLFRGEDGLVPDLARGLFAPGATARNLPFRPGEIRCPEGPHLLLAAGALPHLDALRARAGPPSVHLSGRGPFHRPLPHASAARRMDPRRDAQGRHPLGGALRQTLPLRAGGTGNPEKRMIYFTRAVAWFQAMLSL